MEVCPGHCLAFWYRYPTVKNGRWLLVGILASLGLLIAIILKTINHSKKDSRSARWELSRSVEVGQLHPSCTPRKAKYVVLIAIFWNIVNFKALFYIHSLDGSTITLIPWGDVSSFALTNLLVFNILTVLHLLVEIIWLVNIRDMQLIGLII